VSNKMSESTSNLAKRQKFSVFPAYRNYCIGLLSV
jgi:hypothetical protein